MKDSNGSFRGLRLARASFRRIILGTVFFLLMVFAPIQNGARIVEASINVEDLSEQDRPPFASTQSEAGAFDSLPGDLDPSFGNNGTVVTSTSAGRDDANAIAIQTDGKILIAGTSNTGSFMTVVRYDVIGSLDNSFGSGGIVTTFIPNSSSVSGNAIAIQPDGKIVIAGHAFVGSRSYFVLIKYNSTGSLDTSFNGSGIVVTAVGPGVGFGDEAYALAIQNDGKILVAGNSQQGGQTLSNFGIVRYNSNGSLDTSFGSSGIVSFSFTSTSSDYATSIVLRSDNTIIVGGATYSPEGDFAILRLLPDGTPDTTFGSGGKVITSIGPSEDIIWDVKLYPNGKILAVGDSNQNGGGDVFTLARYLPNGVLDPGFGTNGIVTTDIGPGRDQCFGVAIQQDGKAICAGYGTGFNFALARYDLNGALDPSFGGDGIVTSSVGARALDIGLQVDGKILAVGTSGYSVAGNFVVARFIGASCVDSLTPIGQNFNAIGGLGSFNLVTTPGSCQWSAVSNVPWITVTGGSVGTGNGTVFLSVSSNAGPARTGTVTAGGQTFTINQANGCTYNLSSPSVNLDSGGGNRNFTVITPSDCSWSATSNNAWITVSGGNSGVGNGTVAFAVQQNMSPSRTGTITAGGQTVTINQASGCTYSFSPTNTSIVADGGNGSANLNTNSGCTWNVASNDPWVTITGGGSGSGNGTISFNIQANNGPARTGTITAGGQTFSVNQASGCTYVIAPTSASFGSGAVGGSFALTTSNSACGWTAVANNPWISVSGGSPGTGNGTVFFSVQANTGPARSGTITVGGQTFTIDQANGCTFALSAPSTNIAAGGGNSSFTVTTVAGCARTAVSNEAWITITGGGTGSGSGTVSFNVQSNLGPARSGTITAAGQTFTVNQSSGCTFSISPTSANLAAAGGTGSFTLATVSGCVWTAVSNAPWITISAGGSGAGNGEISFSVSANTLNARTGTITAGGQTFTVNQASGCTFSLSSQSVNIGSGSGTGGFSINGIPACTWTAVRNDPWITITGGFSGSGSGNISFSVAANSGPERIGTITAGGQTFTVNQANGCTFGFTPTGTTFSAGGGVGGFNVATNSACIWTAISNTAWITVNSGAVTGNGSVTFTVQVNSGAARAGIISVASQNFTINQLAASLVSVSGRVLTPGGLGIRNAVVSITDAQGVRQTATTSSFGVYTFNSVRSGETYFISVSSKRYRFSPQTVSVTGNLTNLDFTGLE